MKTSSYITPKKIKMKKLFPTLFIFMLPLLLSFQPTHTMQILSKSKLQKCEKDSAKGALNCSSKIVLNLAVPTEASGREASIVAEIVEVEENETSNNMRTLREAPVITVNKSSVYALFELTYIRGVSRCHQLGHHLGYGILINVTLIWNDNKINEIFDDVAYKPEELYVQTRKCEPDAGPDIVQICERLRDKEGHIIEHTQPICCPCGDQRRVPSSCGTFFQKVEKGKANTAHCLRFPGDWFHVFGIGQSSIGFTIKIEVKTGSKTSEVIVGPHNRTASSNDNFLRANLVGDYIGYTTIPSLDEFFLVIPRQGGPGLEQPQDLGRNFSMWMLLERVRFTLDGFECNKIGVGYEAFNEQPNFCSAPLWSCLHNQLWNFWEADQNRISRNQVPLYRVQGKFERINEHPNAGSHAFSIGITELLNTNLLIELSADDIEFVFQRSPGKITSITVPTFEALTQFGLATITTKNVGKIEASYSLTFDCSTGISLVEEQFYIMKQDESITRSFKLYPTTDQAGRYVCSAILKDSAFTEVDRAECHFTTTSTSFDNGSQIPFEPPKSSTKGFAESIEELWSKLWGNMINFITGKNCRSSCAGFFDISCHVQYICISWVAMFGLLLAIIPTVFVLVYLLHEKGVFDPLYEWWEDHFSSSDQRPEERLRDGVDVQLLQAHHKKYQKHDVHHHKHHAQRRRKSTHKHHRREQFLGEADHHVHKDHMREHFEGEADHHVQKDKNEHRRTQSLGTINPLQLRHDDILEHHRQRKQRKTRTSGSMEEGHLKAKIPHHKPHSKQKE